MIKKICFLSYIYCLLAITQLSGQNSYVQKISRQDASFTYYNDLSFNKTGKLGLISFTWNHHIDLVSLNTDGAIYRSNRVLPIMDSIFTINTPPVVFDYKYFGNYHIATYRTGSAELAENFIGLIVYDENTNQSITRIISKAINAAGSSISVNDNSQLLFNHSIWPMFSDDNKYGIGLSLLNIETGVDFWAKRFFFNDKDRINAYSINPISNHSFCILVIGDADTLGYITTRILNVNNAGIPIKGVRILQDEIFFEKSRADSEGNIFLCGLLKTSGDINNFGIPGVNQLIIAKFSSQLEFIWAKQINVEQYAIPFPFTPVYDIAVSQDGRVLFSISTVGSFPVIVGQLSIDGNLMYYNGYDLFSPKTAIAPDKSLFLMSHKYEDGSIGTLAKTKPDGSIDGCPQFPACISTEDITITIEDEEWFVEDVPPLESYNVINEDINYVSEPSCEVQAYPQPTFQFPDTTCQYNCIKPTAIKNQLAQHAEWQITGPGLDTLIADTIFNWCFDVAGSYTIEQKVWVLGCFAAYKDTLIVLPDDLQIPLQEEVVVCDFPFEITPQSNRPLTAFLWNTGDTTVNLQVEIAGNYALTATDGYCSIQGNTALVDVHSLLSDPILLPLPDTVLCPDLMPYTIVPQSPHTDTFYLNEQVFYRQIAINEAGNYTVSTHLQGCVFESDFELSLEDCAAPIFMPNVFSPNDDGINDVVFPQGLDFEGIQMRVYNRWGGLVDEDNEAPFRWEGRGASPGVYLLVFRYLNMRTKKTEEVVQDVLLLR